MEVKGRILGEKNKPLPYATIVAEEKGSHKPVKAVTSSTSGTFSILLAPKTEYMLKVSYVGYSGMDIPVTTDTLKVLKLGEIILKSAKHQISELVVRPLVEVTSSEIIYNIASDPERAISSMSQIFKKVPMILVDEEGAISVGSTESKYVVTRNGRVDALFKIGDLPLNELLKRLPAMGFSQIRIIKDPPPTFGNVKYQVDIITDKSNSTVGAACNSDASYNMGAGTARLGSQVIASPAEPFRISVGAGFTNTNAPDIRTKRSIYYHTIDSLLETTRKSTRSGESYSGNVAMSYDIGKRDFIFSSFSYTLTNDYQKNYSHSQWSRNDTAYRTQDIRFYQPTVSKRINSLTTYERSLNDKFAALFISCLFTALPKNERGERSMTSTLEVPGTQKRAFEDNTSNSVITAGFRDRKGKLSYGTSLSFSEQGYRSTESLVGYSPRSTETTIQKEEQLLKGILRSGYSFSRKLSVHIGLEYSDLLNNAAITKTTDNSVEQATPTGASYSNDVTLRYAPSDNPQNELTFGYQVSRNLPNISQQAAANNGSDPNYASVGNLKLSSETFHTLSATYGMSRLHYTFSGNKIGPYTYVDANNVTTNTWANGADYHSIAASTFLPDVKVLGIRLILESGLTYNYTKYLNSEMSHVLYWTLSTRLNFPVYKSLRGSFWGYYSDNISSKYFGRSQRTPLSASVTLRYQKSFGSRKTLNFSLTGDIFGWKRGSKTRLNDPSFTLNETTEQSAIPLNFSIRYIFGNFKVRPVRSGTNNAEVSGYSSIKTEQ